GNNWQSVSITDRHACGLRSVSPSSAADQRYCWGLNGAGQLGDGTRTDSATPRWVDDGSWRMVATGRTHACGISSGKYLYCWGSNLDGQLGVGWDVVSDRALEP